jgi:hypothetical protein
MLTYVSPDLELGITNEMTKNLMCHGNVNLNAKTILAVHKNTMLSKEPQI